MVRQLRRIPACLNKDRALTSTAQLSVPCGALTPETLPAVRICCRFAAVRALEMESLGRCFVDTFGHHLAMLHELMGEACPNRCEGLMYYFLQTVQHGLSQTQEESKYGLTRPRCQRQ